LYGFIVFGSFVNTFLGQKGTIFEEDKETLIRNMLRFGFDVRKLEQECAVKILDLESMQGEGVGANVDYILSEVVSWPKETSLTEFSSK